MSKSSKVSSEALEIQGSAQSQFVEIDGVKIRLARPLEMSVNWVGSDSILNELKSAWFCSSPSDHPMNPRLVGKPGVGKTVLAYAVGKMLKVPVFFFQATSDTQPNDVLITPIVVETSKDHSHVEYVASSLVTAMIVGGVCVFDEGNRMQEKAWASLAPLLDSRRYVDCTNIGLLLKAHPKFRFVATMNDDASCFELPEYIKSRLQPQLQVENPDRSEERRILEVNLPKVNPVVLDYVADFLEVARRHDEDFSIRSGIHIAHYAGKLCSFEAFCGRELDPGEAVIKAVEQTLGVRQTRYIKQILWRERAA